MRFIVATLSLPHQADLLIMDELTSGLDSFAKILDTTMRKSWEEAIKQGLFRVDNTGKLKKIDISEIENEDIRKRIEELRVKQLEVFSSKTIKKQMTESSKDALLLAKNKKIKELAEEVKNLKQQLMYLQGKIYDKG